MKRILAISVCVLLTIAANAQQSKGTWSITPKVGVTASTLTGNRGTIAFGGNKKMKLGMALGVDAMYQVDDMFAVSLGAMYAQQGNRIDDLPKEQVYNAKAEFDYILVPLLANMYVSKGLALKIGLQPAFCITMKEKADLIINGQELPFVWDLKDLINDNLTSERISKFDVSIPLGLSYEFGKVIVDARYNIGITKVIKGKQTTKTSTRNNVFMFTIGYKLP